jgi:hypothetical protein
MVAFTFAVVVTTIVLHGFTLASRSQAFLKLKKAVQARHPDCRRFSLVDGPRRKLKEAEVPVMLADQNWNHLAEARLASIPVYFGEVLSEAAHHASIRSGSRT